MIEEQATGLAVAIVALCVILALLLVVWRWRGSVVIRSGSVSFTIFSLLLCALLTSASVLYALPIFGVVDGVYDVCTWLTFLPLAGVLSIGAAKARRIDRIFHADVFRVVVLSDTDLAKQVALALAGEVALLCGFTAGGASPMCSVKGGTRAGHLVWVATQASYIGGLSVYALLMAYKTRSVPAAYNEVISTCSTVALALAFLGVLVFTEVNGVDNLGDDTSLWRTCSQAVFSVCSATATLGMPLYYISTGRGYDRSLRRTNGSRIIRMERVCPDAKWAAESSAEVSRAQIVSVYSGSLPIYNGADSRLSRSFGTASERIPRSTRCSSVGSSGDLTPVIPLSARSTLEWINSSTKVSPERLKNRTIGHSRHNTDIASIQFFDTLTPSSVPRKLPNPRGTASTDLLDVPAYDWGITRSAVPAGRRKVDEQQSLGTYQIHDDSWLHHVPGPLDRRTSTEPSVLLYGAQRSIAIELSMDRVTALHHSGGNRVPGLSAARSASCSQDSDVPE
jgi:hypothetical protein